MLLSGVVPHRLPSLLPAALTQGTRGVTVCILVASACNYPKPPTAWTGQPQAIAVAAPQSAPPRPPPLTSPPPPPPPQCAELAENCLAGPETKLLVGDSGAWFTPPENWRFARTPDGSITVNPERTALMILAPSPDATDIAPAVDAMLGQQGVKGLKVDKLKRRLKKPQQTLAAGDGSVDLWEIDKSQQGESLSLADKGTGTLLVLVGRPAPDRTLFGVGFVVESAAEAEAPKIMKAVQSLRGKP